MDTKVIQQELATIAARAPGGVLTPEDVLEAARREDSPLHVHFEWDDAKAGYQHRLDQARRLIRIRVEVTIAERTVRAPVYVRDPESPPHQQGYLHVSKVRDDAYVSRRVVLDELDRAAAAVRRAQLTADVIGRGAEMEGLLQRLLEVKKSVEVETTV
jgi:hypothetical protein